MWWMGFRGTSLITQSDLRSREIATSFSGRTRNDNGYCHSEGAERPKNLILKYHPHPGPLPSREREEILRCAQNDKMKAMNDR